jgi:hypothetical protein
MAVTPSQEYAQRLKVREDRVAHFEKVHIRVGNLRLALVLLFLGLGWASFRSHLLSPWWLVVPLAAFIAVAAFHARVLRARDLAQRAASFYRQGLARIEDRWAGSGETGERFDDPHHVYASDLDLFTKGGLFELLSTVRTRMGEETLAGWLLAPSSLGQVRERRAVIEELRDQIDLREDLAVLGEDAGVGVYPDRLLNWAESPNQLHSKWLRWLSPVLGLLAIGGVVIWSYAGLITPLLLVVLVEAALIFWMRRALASALHGAEHTFHDLELLSAVMKRVEGCSFESARLRALHEQLSSHGLTNSIVLGRLRRIVDLILSRDNWFVRLLDVPLMYSVQVALAAERWRATHGPALRGWLAAIGEIEALLSLSAYHYEHPGDSFPEFVEGEACFEGEAVGHPLLASSQCVRNNVAFCGDWRVLLISGSNMSGKSTLMRTVGLNVVLAMAGAPVRARRLRLTPLQIGASIRVNDSLQEGSSRFYAEITRLRQIYDLAGKEPALLFLLDELLQGTNSKDRRIGAEGIVRALVTRGAIGMVSTHDLALAEIDGSLAGRLHNVHFQDEIENGRMKFDYTLRDGIVTKSNGIELMRSIGLDV